MEAGCSWKQSEAGWRHASRDAWTAAPEEMPTRRPSSRASRRAIWMLSSLETWTPKNSENLERAALCSQHMLKSQNVCGQLCAQHADIPKPHKDAQQLPAFSEGIYSMQCSTSCALTR